MPSSRKDRPTAWPYVGVAFLIILLFWSRALIHTLTLIRWPLEFVHNFFYFVCALVEVLAFKHLNDPFMWFVLNAVFAALVWGLFVHDLRIIRLRAKDSVGPSSFRLYAIVEADQWLNIRFIMPCLFFFALGSAFAIKMAPGFFLDAPWPSARSSPARAWASWSIWPAWSARSLGITPLISATRAEWRDDVEEGI